MLIFIDFLHNRKFTVKLNQVESTGEKKTRAGVPQNSVLGPILFSIFMSDLRIPTPAKLTLYANDTVIHSTRFKLTQKSSKNEKSATYSWKLVFQVETAN